MLGYGGNGTRYRLRARAGLGMFLIPSTVSCCYFLPLQILMSVLLVLITVTLMLPVPTLLVASTVPVTRDTLEMA
jgi:hypothetical protein